MMMNRRAFSTALLTGAAASLISTRGMAANATPERARNVVLGHGLFADGSSWSEVIPRLQAAGLNVTSVQNPLTTLPEAVASAERVLARQDGPTVLVGHSLSADASSASARLLTPSSLRSAAVSDAASRAAVAAAFFASSAFLAASAASRASILARAGAAATACVARTLYHENEK